MREIKVTKTNGEEKLLYYIKNTFPNLTQSVLYKALRNKDIKINSKRITDTNYILKNGDNIQIYISDNLLFGFPKNINIVYEDENVLVVYKPQGILSNNEDEKIDEPTFEDYIKGKFGQNICVCHRLDRNTSGLLVFSKNEKAYSSLLNAFKLGYIQKEYIAYVDGTNFKSQNMTLEKYIIKDEKTGYSKVVDNYTNGAQKILTTISVESVNKLNDYSVVRVKIHTGKTHQIRAQLLAISHAIIGDSKYGKNAINKKFKKYKQMLYAVKYSFNFPKGDFLSYLNDTCIELNKDYYINKI